MGILSNIFGITNRPQRSYSQKASTIKLILQINTNFFSNFKYMDHMIKYIYMIMIISAFTACTKSIEYTNKDLVLNGSATIFGLSIKGTPTEMYKRILDESQEIKLGYTNIYDGELEGIEGYFAYAKWEGYICSIASLDSTSNQTKNMVSEIALKTYEYAYKDSILASFTKFYGDSCEITQKHDEVYYVWQYPDGQIFMGCYMNKHEQPNIIITFNNKHYSRQE